MKRLENLTKLLRFVTTRDHSFAELEELLEDAYLMGKTDGAAEIVKEMITTFEK